MLNINVICIGKIKEKALVSLIDEYSKRLSKYCKLDIIELNDEKLANNMSKADEEKIKEIECDKILQKIQKIKSSYFIALDLKGKEFTSEKLASKIEQISVNESSSITFIIGGSLGLTNKLIQSCNESICFSKLTFPHQLIRLFLLEQVFRSFKILNNETYHK